MLRDNDPREMSTSLQQFRRDGCSKMTAVRHAACLANPRRNRSTMASIMKRLALVRNAAVQYSHPDAIVLKHPLLVLCIYTHLGDPGSARRSRTWTSDKRIPESPIMTSCGDNGYFRMPYRGRVLSAYPISTPMTTQEESEVMFFCVVNYHPGCTCQYFNTL